jgi:hypothetical protein
MELEKVFLTVEAIFLGQGTGSAIVIYKALHKQCFMEW